MALILIALPLVVIAAFGHLMLEAKKDDTAAWSHWPAC